ncbi:gliding motility-associated C-terminal domain-containing protein [Flavobacteriales bacterium]|nr:gliding motility-associated C-terminal domain-containing protein [Flavobacteriales bacterium]
MDTDEAGDITNPCDIELADCDQDGKPDYQDADDCELTSLEVPEGFSPNGDNQNDYFEIIGLENYPNNSIIIFNRWGNKVFVASPYDNNWQGTNEYGISYGGEELPEGTYFYLLKLTPIDKGIHGYIYITR